MKLILVCLIVSAVCVSACRRTATPEQAASPASSTTDQSPQGGSAVVRETKYFKGAIGSTLGLQMKLVREGDKLSGSYFYQKVGKKIELRGSVDQTGNTTLEEFDGGGKSTGVFKGTWKPEDGLIVIAGDWAKPNGDKKTPFSLQEEPIELSGDVEIVAKQIKEANKKLKYEIDADYPQLTGATELNFEKFNQLIRSLVSKKVASFRSEMAEQEGEENPIETETESSLGIGYTIALANDDLISVELDVGSYYAGAAHPNSFTETVNFDFNTGKAMKLADLFKPGSKYVQALSTYAVGDLKKQAKGEDSMLDDDWIQRGAGPDAENYGSWTIRKNGLGITFDAYQVAPYAAGPQTVVIPYSALTEIIRIDGPLSKFVH